ncbi:MAG: hypothetical protein P4M11_10225 [Candidatus Pacebacteria bacterium]|nr:hypothetical protein [Candidatus Paceibacterota bacterium]
MKFQCFIDVSDLVDCLMVVLPSPTAIENEEAAYHDDYYVQLNLSAVTGNFFSGDVTTGFVSEKGDFVVHFKVSLIARRRHSWASRVYRGYRTSSGNE